MSCELSGWGIASSSAAARAAPDRRWRMKIEVKKLEQVIATAGKPS